MIKFLNLNYGKVLGFFAGCYLLANHAGAYTGADLMIDLGLPVLAGHFGLDLPWQVHKAAESARKAN